MRGAYDARLVVEPGAARLAAGRRLPQPLARMRAAVAAQRRSLRNVQRSFEANREFHWRWRRVRQRYLSNWPSGCGWRGSARRSTSARSRPRSGWCSTCASTSRSSRRSRRRRPARRVAHAPAPSRRDEALAGHPGGVAAGQSCRVVRAGAPDVGSAHEVKVSAKSALRLLGYWWSGSPFRAIPAPTKRPRPRRGFVGVDRRGDRARSCRRPARHRRGGSSHPAGCRSRGRGWHGSGSRPPSAEDRWCPATPRDGRRRVDPSVSVPTIVIAERRSPQLSDATIDAVALVTFGSDGGRLAGR